MSHAVGLSGVYRVVSHRPIVCQKMSRCVLSVCSSVSGSVGLWKLRLGSNQACLTEFGLGQARQVVQWQFGSCGVMASELGN